MGLDYSYTQPSSSLGGSEDSGIGSTEMNIMLDQQQIEEARVAAQRQIYYPPQPEVEFGFPKECYCGGEPVMKTSLTTTDPGRRFYSCNNINDGDCHLYKWWDVAASEEINDLRTQQLLLEEKVEFLGGFTDLECEVNHLKDLHCQTQNKMALLEERVSDLVSEKAEDKKKMALCVMMFVVLLLSMFFMYKKN